ncbi:hypothetical protein [Corynebacterium sp.]|nr:hypothetical protein [Corynebacterium sp.]
MCTPASVVDSPNTGPMMLDAMVAPIWIAVRDSPDADPVCPFGALW